jgi:hypothetical protein
MGAAGLRPVPIRLPDGRAPGFADECRRQFALIAAADKTDAGRADAGFRERVSADPWDDLD